MAAMESINIVPKKNQIQIIFIAEKCRKQVDSNKYLPVNAWMAIDMGVICEIYLQMMIS
jgi:hypothetical protein